MLQDQSILKAGGLRYLKFSFTKCYLGSFSVSPDCETSLFVITQMSGDKRPNRSSLTAAEQRCQHIWPKGPRSRVSTRQKDLTDLPQSLASVYLSRSLSLFLIHPHNGFENGERWRLGEDQLKVSKLNDTDALKPVPVQSSKDRR